MKGFITRTVIGLSLAVGLTALAGCTCYRDIVDPCWPSRYNNMARSSVREIAFAQTDKGHVLDQTIWNWMFDVDPKTGAATDHLNAAGIEHLKYISRRMPVPDCRLFMQNAQDVLYSDKVPAEKLVEVRNDLNGRRIAAIQRFLSTQTAVAPTAYQVAIHDFAVPGLRSSKIVGTQAPQSPIQGAIQQLDLNFVGKLPVVQGFGGGPAATAQ